MKETSVTLPTSGLTITLQSPVRSPVRTQQAVRQAAPVALAEAAPQPQKATLAPEAKAEAKPQPQAQACCVIS